MWVPPGSGYLRLDRCCVPRNPVELFTPSRPIYTGRSGGNDGGRLFGSFTFFFIFFAFNNIFVPNFCRINFNDNRLHSVLLLHLHSSTMRSRWWKRPTAAHVRSCRIRILPSSHSPSLLSVVKGTTGRSASGTKRYFGTRWRCHVRANRWFARCSNEDQESSNSLSLSRSPLPYIYI